MFDIFFKVQVNASTRTILVTICFEVYLKVYFLFGAYFEDYFLIGNNFWRIVLKIVSKREINLKITLRKIVSKIVLVDAFTFIISICSVLMPPAKVIHQHPKKNWIENISDLFCSKIALGQTVLWAPRGIVGHELMNSKCFGPSSWWLRMRKEGGPLWE